MDPLPGWGHDLLVGVGVNLVVAFVSFGAGWAWSGLRRWSRFRRHRRFWKPFSAGGLRIVVGRFLSEFQHFEKSGFLGVGDAQGLAELQGILSAMDMDFEVRYADSLNATDLGSNLILVGGPDANALTARAVSGIPSTLRLGDPSSHEIAILDSQAGRLYAPVTDTASGDLVKDHGVIIRSANPFAPGRQLLLVAGSYGYGTWAGLRQMASTSFLEEPAVAEGRPFECLVETEVFLDAPHGVRMLALRPLRVGPLHDGLPSRGAPRTRRGRGFTVT